MKSRLYLLVGTMVLAGLFYVVFFTEWIKPEPIQIASQVRASVLQPRFGRPSTQIKGNRSNAPLPTVEVKGDVIVRTESGTRTNLMIRTNALDRFQQERRVRLPDWGEIDQAPGGVANVTFSLDAPYVLTAIRVEDVPADGSAPKVFWESKGRSSRISSLLYGRNPQGMSNQNATIKPEPLAAGVPYRLILEAGRRRGTNHFTTLPSADR